MNTRRQLLMGFGAALLLAAGGTVPAAGGPPSVALSPAETVRSFLAARTQHNLAGQYALFSAESRGAIPFAQFDTEFAGSKSPLSHASEDGMTPLLTAVSMFFMDSHGLSGYQFTVAGSDPSSMDIVFVRAQPPGVSREKAFLLKIVTSRDVGAGASRLEMLPSYQKTSSADFSLARDHAQGLVSLSNLRQIGLALVMYAAAHDGRLPDAESWADALLLQPSWAKATQSSGFNPVDLFHDPSVSSGQPWNYAFNQALSGVKLSDIQDPAGTVMVFESTASVKNAFDTGRSLPHPGRHNGGDYYVFADGRATWVADGTKLSYTVGGKQPAS